MNSALYYPHTTIHSEGLLKHSLLLWDTVEHIVPPYGYRKAYPSRDIAEAMELIGTEHVPTTQELESAHEAILEAATSPRIDWLMGSWSVRNTTKRQDILGMDEYSIYEEKPLYRTWHELMQLGVARIGRARHGFNEYDVPPALGLVMMSLLADCCAGLQKQKITDRTSAYLSLMRTIGTQESTEAQKIRGLTEAEEQIVLVNITLKTINTENIPLRTLIDFRKREENDRDLRQLRHRYREGIEATAREIANSAASQADVKEIRRVFAERMAEDMRALKSQLRVAGVKVINRDFAVAIAAPLVGNLALLFGGLEPAQAGLLGAGLLGAQLYLYHKERVETLTKHPMAYLYSKKRVAVF